MSESNNANPPTPVRACIYTRISMDHAGEGLGVQRQEDMCRELAERNGWEVVEVFCDNSVSAYSGKRRESFEELLERTAAGEFDRIITYRTDRMYRRTSDLERLIEAVKVNKTYIEAVASGRIDLSTSDGITFAGIGAYISQGESMKQGERIAAQRAQARARGEWTGGKRPFGYDLVPKEERVPGHPVLLVNEAEAASIRGWAEGLFTGRSLNKMAGEANASGVRTTMGGKWRSGTISRLLQKGVVAGMVEHKGEIVGEGNWEPILDRSTWNRIRGLLSDPSRKPGDNRAKWLLSGFAECARCGNKLHQAPSRNGKTPGYVCRRANGKHEDACGGIRIAAEPTDELVVAFMAQIVEGTALDEMVREQEGHHEILRAEIRRVDAEYEEAFQLWRSKTISNDELSAMRKQLSEERKQFEEALAPLEVQAVKRAIGGNSLMEHWDRLELEQKRMITKTLLDTVLIYPASVRGSKRFEPDRVLPLPKGTVPPEESGPPS